MKKRNNLGQDLGITIRSFDYLTDYLSSLNILDDLYVSSGQFDKISSEDRNELSNPFYKATNFSIWRKIANKFPTRHFYGKSWNVVLEQREYNHLFEEFKKNYDRDLASGSKVLEDIMFREYLESQRKES